MLFLMYGGRLLSRVLVIIERSEIGMYEVPIFMSVSFWYG